MVGETYSFATPKIKKLAKEEEKKKERKLCHIVGRCCHLLGTML